MDARVFNGHLVWTNQDRGECRDSLLDRTWLLAREASNTSSTQALARCAVAVIHLDCSYDESVMSALHSRDVRKMYPETIN